MSLSWTFIALLPLLFSTSLFASNYVKVENTLQPPPITSLNFTSSDYNGYGVSCNGSADGSIDLTVIGGVAPYTYVWSNGEVTEDISGLIAGTYTVTVTDFNGDILSSSADITEPDLLQLSSSLTDVLCFNGNSGSIDITVTGGVTNYSYLWSNASLSEDISSLVAGDYSITVTDANNCTAQSTYTVSEPAELILSATVNDISCFGGNDGTIDLTVAGGTTNYTFEWSNGEVSEDLTDLIAGDYTVTVTDANNCTVNEVYTLTQPTVINIQGSPSNVSCFNGTNGGVNITVTGGTGAYTYLWSNGALTEDISNVVAGTYTVTVTDANNCTSSNSFTISQPTLLNLSGSASAVSCFGGTNGTVNITVSGGTTNYSYQWSNSTSNEDLSNVVAGTYTVTVTDANNCTATNGYVVTQPTALALSGTATNIPCFGGTNGSINLIVSGGTTAYSYLWSNAAITEDLSGLNAGSYTVTVTDANNCSSNRSFTITQPPTINISGVTTAVACNGASTGAVNITVSGGTPSYTYQWSNSVFTEDISNVAAGFYTVTVTDLNNCTATNVYTVTQSSALNLSGSTTAVSCFGGSNGSVNITVSGGTLNYSYLWSNGSVTEDLSNVAAGTYTVTVTDANNCTISNSFTVTQPSALSVSVNTTAGSCNLANGSAAAIVSGGTPTYSYLWSTGAVTSSISNLLSGSYTVTVTDSKGCTAFNSGTVSNSGSLTIAPIVVTNVSCNGGANGAIDISVSGGIGPYTYLWSNLSLSQDISGLTAGTYSVTVTDLSLCITTASAVVTQPSVITITPTITNVSCNNGTNGSIQLSVNGGTSPYTFLWNTGSVSQNISSLAAGSYTVTVTDFNNCTKTQSFTITQPTAISATASSTQATCGQANGSVSVVASGGTGALSYLWNTGAGTTTVNGLSAATYTVTVTDQNNCTRIANASVTSLNAPVINSSLVTNVSCFNGTNGSVDITVSGGTGTLTYLWSNSAVTEDISTLSSNTYSVTVTDDNNCTVTGSYFVSQPSAISLQGVVSNVSCFNGANGSVNLTVTGGTPGYTYLWSNGFTGQDPISLTALAYTVTVTDNNSCTASTSFTVTQPTAISISGSVTGVLCNGQSTGAVDITVSGGTSPYSYVWSNAAITQDINNVTANSYTVTVTDFNSCISNSTFVVSQPTAITASFTSVQPTCANSNGSLSVNALGGVGTYTYLWNTGAATAQISNVGAGTYTVTVTDQNNCSIISSSTLIAITGPSIASIIPTNTTCFNGSNGSINLTTSGGAAPLTYLWSNTAITEDITGLTAGTYTVTVTDANNCTASANATVGQPTQVSGTFTQVQPVCNNSNGSLTINATGGTGAYTYLWNTSSVSNSISGLAVGTYTVTVTDANSCSNTLSSTLTGVSGPTITVTNAVNVQCNGTSTGAIDITVSNGTGPYSYLWSTSAITEDLINIPNGTYTVTVTDANNCTSVKPITITQPAFLSLASFSTVNATCGQSNGSAQVNPAGGITPYSYLWNTGSITNQITNVSAGTYTVTVTDFNGCTRRRNVVISLANGPVISLLSQTDVSCNGGSNGAIDIDVTGGTSPYGYIWTNTAVTQDINGLTAGVYTVHVTDNTGCSDSATYTIVEPSAILIAPTITPASCGTATGGVSLSVSGGTPNYSYLWSTGAVTSSISSVVAGDYTVTVTDAHSCSLQNIYTVTTSSGPSIVVDSTFDARCYGASTGRIYISVTGGTSPFSYLWNDGSGSQDRTGLAAGTYTVTVTDFNTCSVSTQITIGQATLIVPSFTVQSASCNQSNGSLTVSATGGNGSYSYLWETGNVSNQITNQFAGVYSVTVTDTRGCSVIDSATIDNSGQAAILLSTQVNPLCNGLSTGMLTISVSGGVSPYQVQWSNGDVGLTADTLTAGTYTVTVTDQTSCSSQASFTITQPDALTLQLNSVNEHCNKADGSITVNVSGGTGLYTYLWSTSAVINQITGLEAGTYTVTVTDQNNCQASSSAVLINIAAPIINTISMVDANCYNSATGSVDIDIQGGTTPFTYLWSNGNNTQDLTAVVSGTYTVTVTDTFACSAQFSYFINQPTELLMQVTVDDAGCNNNNGSIQVLPSGGVGPYTYLWSDGTVNDNLQNLFAGSYTVTVSDSHLCSIQQIIIVNNLNAAAITLDSLVDVSCNLGSNGAIYVSVAGGASPYTYQWSDNSVTEDLINVAAGIYTLTVSDNNGCVSVYTDSINEPLPLSVNGVVTDAKCGLDNGIVTVTPSGGSSSYSFLWSTSAASSTISSLAAGDYTITVTDSRNCVVVDTFTVINTGNPAITLIAVDSVSCNGQTDGAIDIDVNGGVGPYSYTWIGTSQISQDITGLQAGGYSVIVTDFVGCTSTNSYTVYQPSAINISFPQLTNAACGSNNGSIVVAVSGGDPGYNLLWSNGSINDTIINLSAGSYTVTITDQRGCTKSSQANISNISGPSVASVDSANVSCPGLNDGFITITVSGGTAPYTYSWNTLPDVTPTVTNLSGGTYTVTVKDALNCLVLRSVTITAPNPIAVNTVIPQKNPPYNLTCFQSADGDIFLSVSGGTAPYGFVWSNGSITQNISGLVASTYTVFITDANGCSSNSNYTLTEPPQLIANAGTDFNVCGETTATMNANVPTYGIGSWSVQGGQGGISFNDSTSANTLVSNLPQGDNTFVWTVTDGVCLANSQVLVSVTSAIQAIAGIDRKVCDGEINLNATRPQFGDGYWITFSPGVVIEDSSKAFSHVTNLNYGNNIFQWTVINGTCRDSASVNIYRKDSLECLSKIQLPNAFSPNSDGFNDYFVVKGIEDYIKNDFIVYNRWGIVVYEKSSYQNTWNGVGNDGNPLPDGTYFILLKIDSQEKVYKTYVDLRR